MAGKMLSVEPTVDPSAKLHDTRLGAYCEVGARTILHEVVMDDYSYVVNDAQITYTTIGKFCSIAAMTRINPGNHPMQRASQAHFTYRASAYFPGETDEAEFFEWRLSHRVHIGHDVWIGHGAIVLPGRSVGTGAVVAAGAIVTKDVPAYTIVAGNPARVVKRRFSETVNNRNKLGRIYNMVQHATIGPPFLDETTVVDSNAQRGFMQSSPMPNPEQPETRWPEARKQGQPVDLRHLTSDPDPNVVSFVIDGEFGWVTATNASKELILGYMWRTADYHWLNVWRHVADVKPLARGVELWTSSCRDA
jgi:phosphonate metabolism protein (transferase hexapeptide repeat family)